MCSRLLKLLDGQPPPHLRQLQSSLLSLLLLLLMLQQQALGRGQGSRDGGAQHVGQISAGTASMM